LNSFQDDYGLEAAAGEEDESEEDEDEDEEVEEDGIQDA
jgi:hypothetical protein